MKGQSFFGTDWDRREDYEYVEHPYQVFSTTLHDAATGKTIWSAVSDTYSRPTEKKTMNAYVRAMVKKLEHQKLLTR